MVAHIRYSPILQNTSNPFVLDNAPLINYGNDWATQIIRRKFVAGDIGTNTGQTKDTTADPATTFTRGYLFCQFSGGYIQTVNWATIKRAFAVSHQPNPLPQPTTAPAINQTYPFVALYNGGADDYIRITYRIDNTTPGLSKFYIIDQGLAADTQISPGDEVAISLAIGYP